ncbi:MAG: hypothetical protein JNM91_14290 [Flavobacteriales bacterium]|nr:hypothetical protein [Flavobacteriales bacterium]
MITLPHRQLAIVALLAWLSGQAQCPGILPTFTWRTTGTSIAFTDETSVQDVGIDSWVWDFGDGSPSGSGPSTSHAYELAAIDTVRLTINSVGCSFTTSAVVAHGGAAETCTLSIAGDFTAESVSNNVVAFQDQSDTAGSPVFHFWSFADGALDLVPDPVHFFSQPGIYDVTHSIVTLDSQFQTACTAGRVQKLAVDGNASSCDTSVFLNLTVVPFGNQVYLTADVVVFDQNVTITGLNWDYGDGLEDVLASPDAAHFYPYGGTYQVCVDVSAQQMEPLQACSARACETIDLFILAGIAAADETDGDVHCVPNPCGDGFSAIGPAVQVGTRWQVFDAAGLLHAEGLCERNGEHRFDTSDWPPGIWSIRLVDRGASRAFRVMKQ